MKSLKSVWLWVCIIVVAALALFFVDSIESKEVESKEKETGKICNIQKTIPVLEASDKHIDAEVLELGLKAYNCAIKSGMDEQEILTLIDYRLPSNQKRLWVFDLHRNRILFTTWVAHGQGSGGLMATEFSDTPESHQSSIGMFLTGGIYTGKHGHSLTLYGLEEGFNAKAEARHIVIHSAKYVTKARAESGSAEGRSWGCPALPPKKTEAVIQTIKDGTLVFSYYPDPKWLAESKYLNCMDKD